MNSDTEKSLTTTAVQAVDTHKPTVQSRQKATNSLQVKSESVKVTLAVSILLYNLVCFLPCSIFLWSVSAGFIYVNGSIHTKDQYFNWPSTIPSFPPSQEFFPKYSLEGYKHIKELLSNRAFEVLSGKLNLSPQINSLLVNLSHKAEQLSNASPFIEDDEIRIGVYVTTCGRADLLNLTLTSFVRYNTRIPMLYKILIDDCHKVKAEDVPGWTLIRTDVPQNMNREVRIVFANLLGYLMLVKMLELRVDYIFHSEDDWEYFQSNFVGTAIEADRELANGCGGDSEVKASTVCVSDTNRFDPAPKVWTPKPSCPPCSKEPVYYLCYGDKGWMGFTYNPGVMNSIAAGTMFLSIQAKMGYQDEHSISQEALARNYHVAYVDGSFARHMGGKRHVGG